MRAQQYRPHPEFSFLLGGEGPRCRHGASQDAPMAHPSYAFRNHIGVRLIRLRLMGHSSWNDFNDALDVGAAEEKPMDAMERRVFLKGAGMGMLAFTVGGADILMTPGEARARAVPFRMLNA